jgi:hypothetical protein
MTMVSEGMTMPKCDQAWAATISVNKRIEMVVLHVFIFSSFRVPSSTSKPADYDRRIGHQKKTTRAFPGWGIRLRGVHNGWFRILNQLVRVAELLVYRGFLPHF